MTPGSLRHLPLIAAALLGTGCAPEPPPPPPAARPSVLDPQLKALEAARAVEGTLKEGEEARRRQLEAAEK